MIYVAILIACLSSAPADCRQHEIRLEGPAVPYAQFIEAQTKAAEWLAKRPGMVLRSLVIRAGEGA